MKFVLFFSLYTMLFYSISLGFSQEKAKKKVLPLYSQRLSTKYISGRYLIYDCEDKHFVCTDQSGFSGCVEKRKEDKLEKRSVLTCAPLHTFKTIEECRENQKKLVHTLTNKQFCVN